MASWKLKTAKFAVILYHYVLSEETLYLLLKHGTVHVSTLGFALPAGPAYCVHRPEDLRSCTSSAEEVLLPLAANLAASWQLEAVAVPQQYTVLYYWQ